jgi:HlyD family secretion protein
MTKDGSDVRRSSAMLPISVGFATIFLMLGGFSVWAMRAEIDGAVVASGRIVVDRNRQAVQHPAGGVVDEILVQEGDTVHKDELLVRLDPKVTQSELRIVEGQLFELMARRARLEAERSDLEAITFDQALLDQALVDPNVEVLVEGQRRLFAARLESLQEQISQLRNQKLQLGNQIGGIDAQKAALELQIELIGSETDMQKTLLEKGLAQISRVLTLQREAARLSGSMGEMTARRAQAMEQVAELNIQELQLYTQRREEANSVLRDLQFNEMEQAERRATLKTQLERMDIRAPVSGVLYDLRLFGPQSVVRPADPLMYIVPQDRPLLIEAQVQPMNVNEIYVGQDVILRFVAFDMRETPDLIGVVLRVSPDAFTDPQSGRSYYRAEIELPKTEVSKLSAGQVLIPGMPVDAFIKTGTHTPMTYLTEPLTRYFDSAMRDGG